MFSRALVRTPCEAMVDGLSSANLGKPDFSKALAQHAVYVKALRDCGLDITVLEADSRFPNSTFIEDTALLVPGSAIITRPGAPSRRGETAAVKEALKGFFTTIEHIIAPGTLDAGDIMIAESHLYIGLSERTNREGAEQLRAILAKYGLSSSSVPLRKVLHLKSAIAYLNNNTMVAAGAFVGRPEFRSYRILAIDDDERYAANCLWINGHVLIPEGFPKTQRILETAGYETTAIDVSEFRKIDGGLSCLSLRF